uniref:Uncharacterized protein n=1 Tax=Triticum urartu TaxID=4572 RepID=A0A8R7TF28_TRIUA
LLGVHTFHHYWGCQAVHTQSSLKLSNPIVRVWPHADLCPEVVKPNRKSMATCRFVP